MNKANECTCPSGDGSLVHPCPAHPAVEQAGANVGHGHVLPRADGVKMRCGGPGLCSECTADASRARAALAQPSPAQAEKAEVERTEGSADLLAIVREAVAGAYNEWKMISEAVTEIMEAHERIVGELRADRDSWAEQAEQRLADWDEMRKERDAALARVAEFEAQAQHSVPEGLAEFSQFLSAVMDAAGLVRYGRRSKELSEYLGAQCMKYRLSAPVAQAQHSLPEGWMLVECGIWTQEQVDEMQKTVARFRNSEFVDNRALAMAVADAGQCKAPEISLAELLAAAPGKEVPQAWLDVQTERRRQVEAEGWTPEHDDEHDSGELAAAGAAYALHAADHLNPYSQGDGGDEAPSCWPWHDGIAGRGEGPEKTEPAWWKPSTPRRDLVKACALALAEIERLDRAAHGKEGV